MTKNETKLAKAEIRSLKSALNKRQKDASRRITGHRANIRANERTIVTIERETTAFVRDTTDRIAILQGRLNS
jgi:hypothetical protein